MKLTESIRISWRAITGHKLRSTLTTLGVIIGIGAVIVFMVLGGAFEADILGDIEDEEEPIMQVVTQSSPEGGFGVQFVQTPIYTESDIEAIERIEGVEYVAPDVSIPATQVDHAGELQTGGFSVKATTSDQFADDVWEMIDGEPFEDGTEGQAVINEILAEGLDTDPEVGDEITVMFEDGRSETLTVTGIVDDDTDQFTPPAIYVPIDPYYTLTIETPGGEEERAYSSLVVAAESVESIDRVQADVVDYLETDSDAQQLKGEEHNIQVQTIGDIIEQVTDIIDQFAIFLGGIAAISLVVGSIGIANIMIVSVTERTREIGIMKAVGARRRDIMQLFLVESLILGIIGAVVGVLVGLGFGYLGTYLAGWPMAYPTDWILIAVLVGIVVGVVSGLYPAWRGAKVDPIEALRHE